MNELFQDKYRIPTIRLLHWDYARDARYFITTCTKDRKIFFGEIINGQMILNEIGKIINQFWLQIPKHFPGVFLDEYIIMPNHLHGNLDIQINYQKYLETGEVAMEDVDFENLGMSHRDVACNVSTDVKKINMSKISPKPKSLSTIIRSFKSACTNEIHKKFPNLNFSWQSRFYEHIIKNDESFFNIQQYIRNNPINWEQDRNNPANLWM